MIDSDKRNFEMIMIGVGELYSKDITKPLLRIYFSSLKNYSLEDVERGLGEHAVDPKHGSYFPKPADIVRNLSKGDLSASDKAELAWSQVVGEIARIGSYGSLSLSDGQAMAAVKALGSWKDLCATQTDKMDFKKREFIAVYKTYENTPANLLPDKLPGLIELQKHKEESSQSLQQLMNKMNTKRLENKNE
ncbi:MAG: DUF6475 domain-containing protein [Emcibacteraceae bacterium]|nr:DUF6475 domain-containing protein [Emcibacteraceae bacterium]